ncbi:MAG: hypothetical protein RLZ35_749 [Pseudomonadota bacterium]
MLIMQSIIGFVIAIGILVAIHEWGHFWVARKCGVKVLRFSIGFGPALLRWHDKQGTEYVLAAIPLGGYVKMLGEQDAKVEPALRHLSFSEKPVWKRAAVVVAGPLVNILFSVLALWLVFMMGVPVMRPVIGPVTKGGLAAQAGLLPREEIVAVNQGTVHSWEEVMLSVTESAASGDEVMDLELKSLNKPGVHHVQVPVPTEWLQKNRPDFFDLFGLEPYDPVPATIATVSPGKAADQAGFKAGDTVLVADGQEMVNRNQFAQYVQKHPNQTMSVTVLRNGEKKQLRVIPQGEKNEKGQTIGVIGIAFIPGTNQWDSFFKTQRLGPIDALIKATQKTGRYAVLTIEMMGKMFTGNASLKNIGGPVTIAKQAGHSVSMGFVSFIQFLAIISVSLGVLNLLPLPVLDGGHLLFYAYEAIRRKPLSMRLQEAGYRIGFVLLMMLMGLALYNDFTLH